MPKRKSDFRHLSPPSYTGSIWYAFTKAVEGKWWAPGARTTTFERKLAAQLDVPPEWVIATTSCTDALWAAATLEDLKQSPRVCPLTWPATYSFATDPIYIDCDEKGWPRATVDIGVEIWGNPWAGPGLPAILDAAHRFADPEHGRLILQEHTNICYSFAPQKEVPCFMGGALVTRQHKEARILLNSGTKDRKRVTVGRKGLMPNVVAAWLSVQLARLPYLREKRARLLEEYEHHLGGMLLTKPHEASGHLCVINCGDPAIRSMFYNALQRRPTIESGHHYPLDGSLRELCPTAYKLSQQVLTLPLHVEMSIMDVRRICARILQA